MQPGPGASFPASWRQGQRGDSMPIDHVELFVPRREDAAAWYGKVLGCEVLAEYRSWATGTGPLMISNDGGETKIALFKGPPMTTLVHRDFTVNAGVEQAWRHRPLRSSLPLVQPGADQARLDR